MERRDLAFLGAVTVVRRAGSLQVTIPVEAVKMLGLESGQTVFFLYDKVRPSQLELVKPSAVTLSDIAIEFALSVDQREVLTILENSGAYLPEGHYNLASGMHSNRYVHVRLALASEKYATELARRTADKFRNDSINVVAGFTVGGILLAEAVAKSLNAKLLLGEKKPAKERVEFVNLNVVEPDDNILLVDDVLTTGMSLQWAMAAIRDSGKGVLKGVGVIVDRSGGGVNLGIKTIGLIRIDIVRYRREDCPLCSNKVPERDMSAAESDRNTTLSSLPDKDREILNRAFDKIEMMLKQARSEPHQTASSTAYSQQAKE